MVGSGVIDLGNIGVIPSNLAPSKSCLVNYGYKSSFSHQQESAKPGHYSVLLLDPNIRVELTATQLVAFHKYTWLSSSSQRYVYFNVSHALDPHACKAANVSIDVKNREVSGWMLNSGSLTSRFGGLDVFFVAKFGESFSGWGVWENEDILANATSGSNPLLGAYLNFPPSSSPLEFVVGISMISVEQARKNIQNQVGNNSFEAVKRQTQDKWEEMLSIVQVSGGTLNDFIKFYSFLYHSFQAPTNYSYPSSPLKLFQLSSWQKKK